MIAVMSPPRNGDAALARRTLLHTANIDTFSERSADCAAGGGPLPGAADVFGTNDSLAPNDGMLEPEGEDPAGPPEPNGPAGPCGALGPTGPPDRKRRSRRRDPPVRNTRLKPIRISMTGQKSSQILRVISPSLLRNNHVPIPANTRPRVRSRPSRACTIISAPMRMIGTGQKRSR